MSSASMNWICKAQDVILREALTNSVLDIVGTVYHLVICMQSNKINNVVLMGMFYSALILADFGTW